MLGALISFIGFALAIYWWSLDKQFRRFRKGEDSMPVILFVIYCILSFVVLGFIIMVVLSWLPEVLPRPYNYEISLFIEALIVISFIIFQCFRYIKIAKNPNKLNVIEDVDLEIE